MTINPQTSAQSPSSVTVSSLHKNDLCSYAPVFVTTAHHTQYVCMGKWGGGIAGTYHSTAKSPALWLFLLSPNAIIQLIKSTSSKL